MPIKAVRIRLDIDPNLVDYDKVSSNKIWYYLKFKECPTISLMLNDICKRYMWKQTSHLRVSLLQYLLPKDETTEIIEEDETLSISYFKCLKRRVTEGSKVDENESQEMKTAEEDNICTTSELQVIEESSNAKNDNLADEKGTDECEFEIPVKRKRSRRSRNKNKIGLYSANEVPMEAYTNSSIVLTNSSNAQLLTNVKPPKSKRKYKEILPPPSHITFQSDDEISNMMNKNNTEIVNDIPLSSSFNSQHNSSTENIDASKKESDSMTEQVYNGDSKVITPTIQNDILVYKRPKNKKELKLPNTSISQDSSISSNKINFESIIARGKEIKKPPDTNHWIVYKILELGSSYTPEISDFRFGKVIDYDQVTQQLDIKLVHIKSDETYELGTLDTVCWTSMIEPRVVQGFDLANLKK